MRCSKCMHWIATQCKNGRRCPYCQIIINLKDPEVKRKSVKNIHDAAIAVKKLNECISQVAMDESGYYEERIRTVKVTAKNKPVTVIIKGQKSNTEGNSPFSTYMMRKNGRRKTM